MASSYVAWLDRLTRAGIPDAKQDLHEILHHVLPDIPVLAIDLAALPLAPDEIDRIEAVIDQRAARIPLERIFGYTEIASLTLEVAGGVHKPYPETEDVILKTLTLFPDQKAPLRILDIGTGSGVILLGLLKALPYASGVGLDLSPEAIIVAERNAASSNLADRAAFRVNDWTRGIKEQFDLVISNPPRVATADIPRLMPEMRDHDPLLSLDGSEDGLRFYHRLADDFRRLIKPDGFGCIQVGARYADAGMDILRQKGLANIALHTNLVMQPLLIAYQHKPHPSLWRRLFRTAS